eukprot:TRINITY_DN4034_c0_g2_i1.p1 TRINITY_DN4034_c0_g2~~TRINITY_DN4034_c0_g2_i1.p1  ORF type:complete len:501 (-),score=124.34 TRINITY_DN4034_c0_g2_i1:84-1586(-)
MGFFKLGKIDKAAADAAGKADKGPEAKATNTGPIAMIRGTTGSQEKSEKKKKKAEADGSGTAGDVLGPMATNAAPVAAGGGIAPGGAAKASSGPSVNDFITKTKTQFISKGLKPSGPELIAYARYLGIDPVADHDLLWIATEALEAPLPSEWTEHFDSNDRVFYYNATTKVSSWTHPLEHDYRETYETIVNFRNSNVSPVERGEQLHRMQLECEQMERDVHREVGSWTEHTDEHGHRFYYNAQARQSTWQDPRPAKCHILYLRMKMIRVLESSMRSTGGAAQAAAQAQAHAETKDGMSKFVPAKDGLQRDGSETSKRPKVAEADRGAFGSDVGGGVDHGVGQGHQDRQPDLLGEQSEAEEERKQKKKKKKKRDTDRHDPTMGAAPGHAEGMPAAAAGRSMQASASEPSVGGKVREPASLFPDRGGFGSAAVSDSEGLSTVGRPRIKAGIRLQPIGSVGFLGPPPAHMASVPGETQGAPGGMQSSASSPELKPLEKLQPLM